jgi:hypothetical protein
LYAKTSGSSQANATNISSNTTDITTNTTAITANTAKVGYTEALVSANTDVVANTAKVVITTAQVNEITANNAKTGITTGQASAITTNTAKVGYTDARVDAIISLQKGQPYGLASLDVGGIIPSLHLPPLAITDVYVVADLTARDVLTPQQGDVAKVSDNGSTYIYDGSFWISIQETSAVTSVNGRIGAITLTTTDIPEGYNKYYTEALVSANTDVVANTLKEGYTEALVSANTDVVANTLKDGITEGQATAITENMTKLDEIEALMIVLEGRITALEEEEEARIGDYRAGGVVFWLDPTDNRHGLVCAIEDQSAGIRWYNGSYTATGATATAIGTGLSNTLVIIADQGAVETSYAAGLARAYSGGGYDDWFLPSKDELNAMYQNKATINSTAAAYSGVNFVSDTYWSSTEDDIYAAWKQYFTNGDQSTSGKVYTSDSVRAVRAF